VAPLKATRSYPRAFSPQALGSYSRCPRQYALRYLVDAEREGSASPALVLGNAVHAAMATLYRLPPRERSEAAAHRALRAHWTGPPRRVFLSPEEEAYWGRRGLDCLSTFCSRHDLGVRPIALEEWVRATLPGGRRVCGRVDRVDYTKDGLVVIDYKTGRRPQDFEPGDDLGARIYALAATRTFRRAVVRVKFLWLVEERADTWEVARDELGGIEDELEELVERLRTDRTLLPRPGDHCRHCDFRRLCPARDTARLDELEIADDLPF
jgi:RecB family exonuclease